jgi:hypothetical protein
MAFLRAFLKDSTQHLEWEVAPGVNRATLARAVAPIHENGVVVIPTIAGRLRLDPTAYAALEIVGFEDTFDGID